MGSKVAGTLAVVVLVAPAVRGQTTLPSVVVPAPASEKASRPKERKRSVAAKPSAVMRPTRGTQSHVQAVAVRPREVAQERASAPPPIAVTDGGPTATSARLDARRDGIFTRLGANATDLGKEGVDLLPQGANAPLNEVLLRFPGVTRDSQAQGGFHIRNEHANVQYRLNGIMLPDAGIAGFGQFLETSLVGNIALLDGALPAQFGLRTAGILDIKTRAGAFDGGGSVSVYGGSRATATTQLEFGGTADGWSYFVTGRGLTNRQGIENPAPTFDPIHDRTEQGRYFAYLTKEIDASTRLAFISGAYSGVYQIPNNPGQIPAFTAFGLSDFDSRRLNEKQAERTFYNLAAYQTSTGPLDLQVSAFSRYGTVRYRPDLVGDILFNGNATDVFRSSLSHGLQVDAAYRWAPDHTTRFGALAQTEHTRVVNGAVVLPTDADGNAVDDPFGIVDRNAKTGYTAGAYVQHEWSILPGLALNTGLRFDQNWSFVSANQVSPRLGVVWTPASGTTFHAGYARYFTPPQQALATPTNFQAFAGTTQEATVTTSDPVRPERSHYFDIGVDQAVSPNFKVGVAFYYKRARNLLDDGQFGPALILTTFNYDRAYNTGVEAKATYDDGTLRAYGNIAWARQRATKIISNQYLFDPDELAYLGSNYVYTDHAQTITASAGANLRVFDKTRLGFDLLYGSGLRSGDYNTSHLPAYATINLGGTHELQLLGALKPTTLRLDVVNLLDRTYLIRDGSGIGVFAPQYGQRRGLYAGISQRF